MTRPRAADDFAVIRARIQELRRERVTRVRAADDFAAIRARMEELRCERVRAPVKLAARPLPPFPDHAATGAHGRQHLLRVIRQKFHQ